ncbi:9348_t:CDS:2, partial [Racocetra fulgida]
DQFKAFMEGFNQLIPQELISVFDERELECVRSWDGEKKSRLLQFTTGTSRIPVNGFKDLQGSDGPRRFTIEKAVDTSQLPK